MRVNKIWKITMSAVMMASMASGTVLAEETQEETGEYSEINETAESMEIETIQEETLSQAVTENQEMEPGMGMESNCEDKGEPGASEQEEEGVYVMMGTLDSLPAEEAKETVEQSERVKLEKYGPCGMSLTKEKEIEIEETVPLYTDEDLYILAHAICGEGQCCPDDEQLYIGSVILNRRSHGAYPNSIQEVVFQRGQYACTWDGNYYREPTEANWRNARWLLENGSILPGNVVYQAGFRQGRGVYLQTRYHKYCYR